MEEFSKPNYKINEVKQFLSINYDIEAELTVLPGEKDQNFKIEAQIQDYKLKISDKNEKKEFLQLQNKLLIHLENKNFNTPLIAKSNHGEYITSITHNDISNFVRLVTYLPGKVLADINTHDDLLFNEFGRFIARLTEQMKDFNHPAAHRYYKWDLINASDVINNHIADIEKLGQDSLQQLMNGLLLILEIHQYLQFLIQICQ